MGRYDDLKEMILNLDRRLFKLEELIENSSTVLTADELEDEAIKLTQGCESVSPSYFQRRLQIGYARARRIIDSLESKGILVEDEKKQIWQVKKLSLI